MSNPRNNRRMLAIAAGAIVLVLAGAIAYPAVSRAADDQAAEPTPTAPFDHREAADSALAAALGVTTEELDAARASAAEAALAQAVEEGYLTQSQADQLSSRLGDGFDLGGRGGLVGLPGFAGMESDWDTLLADSLGISVDDVAAARDQVFADELSQAVTDGRINHEEADLMQARRDLAAYMQPIVAAAREQALKDAVTEGVVTQEQLDALQAGTLGFPGGRMGGMFGMAGKGGMHGMPGMDGQFGQGGRGGPGDFDDEGGHGGHGGRGGPGEQFVEPGQPGENGSSVPDFQPNDSTQDQSQGNG